MTNFKAAAVVVWMPEGDEPTIKLFQCADDDMPAIDGCWELGVALTKAAVGPRRSGKQAWVKVGDQVLSPEECTQAYERFKNAEPF